MSRRNANCKSAPIRAFIDRLRRGVTATLVLGLMLATLACSTVRVDVPRPVSEAWARPAETALGKAYEPQLDAHRGRSGVFPLVSGTDAFAIRAALAESAERTLDLQYHLVREDTTTQMLISRVLRAAQRGVRVRLLVDDLDALGKEMDLATLAGFPGIEVRVFNPFSRRGTFGVLHILEFIGDAERLNRRMHNKLWIADNAMAVVGGRNLADEYFDASAQVNFTDFDVLTAGPVVAQVSQSFDAYWNSEWAIPIQAFVETRPGPEALAAYEQTLQGRVESFRSTEYARGLRESHPGPALRSGQLAFTFAAAEAVFDSPSKPPLDAAGIPVQSLFSRRIRPLIDTTRNELILISPYFIPSEQGITAIGALVKRGIRVRVLTNSLASAEFPPLAQAGYARLRPRLLAAGIELHEMRPDRQDIARRRVSRSSAGSLHAKAIVIDRRHVVVGSMNLDPRSRQSNTEVGVLFDSTSLATAVGDLFDDAVIPRHAFRVTFAEADAPAHGLRWTSEENGAATVYEHDPLASSWLRLLQGVLGAIAPEELL